VAKVVLVHGHQNVEGKEILPAHLPGMVPDFQAVRCSIAQGAPVWLRSCVVIAGSGAVAIKQVRRTFSFRMGNKMGFRQR
jgi:hypothetical protein